VPSPRNTKLQWTTNNILIATGLVVGGVALVWGITSSNRRRKKAELKAAVAANEFTDKEIRDEPVPSNISENDAMRRAGILYTSMVDAGTMEQPIYQAMIGVNKAGLMLIYNKFGIRRNENLYQWFIDDLNYKELAIVREIWRRAGIMVPF